MPSLEELRRKLRGSPEAQEEKPKRRDVPAAVPTRNRKSGGRYKISSDGDDALILFGKHSGSRVSEMVSDPDKKRYLKEFVLASSSGFSEDLKSVVRHQLSEAKKL